MYSINVKNTSGYAFDVSADGYTCKVDARAGGMTPPGMLLGALGSCIGVYIRKYADGAKLGLGEFEVRVEAEFTKVPPARFDNIRVMVDLKGNALDERRRRSLIEFVKNCPVHNTLSAHPAVEISLI